MEKVMVVLIVTLALIFTCQDVYPDQTYDLAKKFGPLFYQDVDIGADNGIGDFITSVNFDGNWKGDDNWNNLDRFKLRGLPAYVYFSVTSTEEYQYILYVAHHPRDWDDEKLTNQQYLPGLSAPQHENDTEAVFLIINSSDKVQALCTMAHGRWYNYPVAEGVTVKPGYKDDRQGDDGPHFTGNRLIAFMLAEAHAVYACPISWTDIQRWDPSTDYFGIGVTRWDIVDFPKGIGITYFPADIAQIALPIKSDKDPNRFQSVGYQLISLEELWDQKDNPELFLKDRLVGTNDGYDDPDPLVNNPANDNIAQAPWAWEAFYNPASFAAQAFDIPGLNQDYTLDNPPWIKSGLERSLILEIFHSEPIDPRTVAADKYAAFKAQVRWDKEAVPDGYTITSACFLWNGESGWASKAKYSLCYKVYPNTTKRSGYLRRYLSQDGFLLASINLTNEETKERFELRTDTLWVELRPHQYAIHVSKENGSDETGTGSKDKPLANLRYALDKIQNFLEAPRRYRQTRPDTIYLAPGKYEESFSIDFPVAIVGTNAYDCIIGSPVRSNILNDESGLTSFFKGLNFTSQIWAWETRFKITECIFTNENWKKEGVVMPIWPSKEWAMSIEGCSSISVLEHNTFDGGDGLLLINSDIKIYSNLFTENCECAIWLYNCGSVPTIGGHKTRANAFMNKSVNSTCTSNRYFRYNWWGTPNPAVIALSVDDWIDFGNYLLNYPPGVGAPTPADFNGDNVVDEDDFISFVEHFGKTSEDKEFDRAYDLDRDGHVGLGDFLKFIRFYNR